MTTFVVKFDLAVGVDNLLEDAAPQIRRKPVLWSCQRIKDSWRQEKVRNRVVGWSVTMVPHNFLKRDWSDPPSEVHKKQRTIGPPELSSCRSFILIAGHPRDKSCLCKSKRVPPADSFKQNLECQQMLSKPHIPCYRIRIEGIEAHFSIEGFQRWRWFFHSLLPISKDTEVVPRSFSNQPGIMTGWWSSHPETQCMVYLLYLHLVNLHGKSW